MASVRSLLSPAEAAPSDRPPSAAEFPGCKPVHLPRWELRRCEMRLEYWDAATETAWVCDPVSSCHEGPTQRLTGPDDPFLGSQRRLSHAVGRAEGRAEGRIALARALLAARGIEVSAGFPGVPGFAELPDHAIAEAAAACQRGRLP